MGGPLFCRQFSFFMDFLRINLFFYASYRLRLLLIVCGDIESNPGPGSDRRVRVLYSNIRDLHASLDELAVAGSYLMFWFVLRMKSLIAAISQSYISLALVAPNRG